MIFQSEINRLEGVIADRDLLQTGLCMQHTLQCWALFVGLNREFSQLRVHPGGVNPNAAHNVAVQYQTLIGRELVIMYGFQERQRLQEILEDLRWEQADYEDRLRRAANAKSHRRKWMRSVLVALVLLVIL